jgi:hypothetical protein
MNAFNPIPAARDFEFARRTDRQRVEGAVTRGLA